MGSDEERHSHSIDPEVIADPVERTHRETRNGLLQAEQVLEWVENFTADGRPFRLRPSMILSLHRTAMEGVKHLAGTWRTGAVEIVGSKHIPQAAYLVPGQVEEMCDWIEERWATATAVELAAYAMWRMNWIHPFVDGNGRTARAVSYLVLCAKLGYRLPGLKTIPEHIAANKKPYYEALEAADGGSLAELEAYLGDLLARQLLDVYESATGTGSLEVRVGRTEGTGAKVRSGGTK